MKLLNKRILIVCHDIGGAEIIFYWLKNNPNNIYYLLTEGPALIFFNSHKLTKNILTKRQAYLLLGSQKIDFVLTGTSWESNIENKVVKIAKDHSITTASYLDHWSNYRERFRYPQSDWKKNLPDYIWCGDQRSIKVAKDLSFPEEKLKLVPNEYFKEILNQSKNKQIKEIKNSILYLSEPIEEVMGKVFKNNYHLGYTEHNAIKFFFQSINKIIDNICLITIRLHPQEEPKKYNNIIENQNTKNYKIQKSNNKSLLEDLLSHQFIFGCQTNALAIACFLKKNTFYSIPPGGKNSTLPFNEILYMRDLLT